MSWILYLPYRYYFCFSIPHFSLTIRILTIHNSATLLELLYFLFFLTVSQPFLFLEQLANPAFHCFKQLFFNVAFEFVTS
ncbi:hypothetical protein CW304_00070 [Bacillus sp. UFRGS-B20]|nr:hypothetical protein CW304_00070 [Bacillus sp. UFRGS-B20]